MSQEQFFWKQLFFIEFSISGPTTRAWVLITPFSKAMNFFKAVLY